MNFEELTVDQLEERRSAIAGEIDNEGADLDALEAEVRGINAELEKRAAAAEKKQELRGMVAAGAGTVINEKKQEERKMPELKEIRKSAEYVNAYAEYLKTGNDAECRALLSTNGTNQSLSLTGYVPVPEMVEEGIRTAWDENTLLNLVKKSYVKGNLKVGFELSAGAASVHAEGAAAPNEETLTLGVVTLIAESVKKWITVSDEALDLSGEALMDYLVREISYQITKEAESILVDKIAALPSTATATSVSAASIATAPSLTAIAEAMGAVHGQDLAIVMNRGTWAAFKAVQYAANFAIDIFEGQKVVFTDALPAFSDADEEDVYAIIGDFRQGALANFPNGEEISIKIDSLSLAEKDLVKIVGREYLAIGPVGDKRFALLTVPEEEDET